MWTAIAGVIQIIAMILKNKLEIDAEERKRKDVLLEGWHQVITSGDSSAITAFADRLHK